MGYYTGNRKLAEDMGVSIHEVVKIRRMLGLNSKRLTEDDIEAIREKSGGITSIYREIYARIVKNGYMRARDMREEIGITHTNIILEKFERINCELYLDTEVIRSRDVPVFRALKPLYDKWAEERKKRPSKNGYIATNQGNSITGRFSD